MSLTEDPSRVERFRPVYDLTYPRVMAYAMRRAPTRQDALDAVSETFLVVWRRLDDLPEANAAMPWVYGVARRVLANQYRARDRRSRLQDRLKSTAQPGNGDGSFDLVHQALDQLRPDDREILTLNAWDGLDNHEIGEVLGLSAEAVAVKAHRARKRLARQLAGLGVGPPANGFNQVKSEDTNRTPKGVNGTAPGSEEVEPT